MKKAGAWRRRFLRTESNRPLVSWLTEPDSLTARCQRQSRSFRVRLLGQRLGAPTADESRLFAGCSGQMFRLREVLLECDGKPVIFAHTALPLWPRGRLSCWLARLGSRSLGSLLFAYPGFLREAIEVRRLDSRHPLFQRAVAAANLPPLRHLWARRSMHRLGQQRVLVTEVFLPAIGALP